MKKSKRTAKRVWLKLRWFLESSNTFKVIESTSQYMIVKSDRFDPEDVTWLYKVLLEWEGPFPRLRIHVLMPQGYMKIYKPTNYATNYLRNLRRHPSSN